MFEIKKQKFQCSYCGREHEDYALSVEITAEAKDYSTPKKRLVCWDCIIKVLDTVLGAPKYGQN